MGPASRPTPERKEGSPIESKRETPQDRYHKAHTTSVTIRFMNHTESDLLEKLNSVPNKAGYIKTLIRADIAQ